MKICSLCSKTYADDNLNFCLEDGAVLNPMGGDTLPETVMMSSPPPTQPNSPFQQTDPNTPFIRETPTHQSYRNSPTIQAQPKAKSKGWLWALLALGGVALLCGGGFVGLLAFAGFSEDSKSSNISYDNSRNNKTPVSNDTTNPDSESDKTIVDLSKWNVRDNEFGDAEFKNGEYVMSSKKPGSYYVLVNKFYETQDAATKITVRNVDEKETRLGFGVVFNSDEKPLQRGYAFLIDSENQRYRIVNHTPNDENTVVRWTKSSVIKRGSQKNVLEVRDNDGKTSFYINGQFMTSEKDAGSSEGGVPGMYVGDAAKIAFSDFSVTKN